MQFVGFQVEWKLYKSTLYSGSHEREGKVSGPSRPGWCGIIAHVCVEEEETEACNHAVVAEEARSWA